MLKQKFYYLNKNLKYPAYVEYFYCLDPILSANVYSEVIDQFDLNRSFLSF